MKRLFVGVFLTLCFLCNIRSQTLLDSFSEIRSLISNGHIEKGDSLLNNIEYKCIDSNDDLIKCLYNENKGWILLLRSSYKECIPYFKKTIDLYERLNIKSKNYLITYTLIGYAYGMMDDYKNAENYYRRALIKSFVIKDRAYNFQNDIYSKLAFIYDVLGESSMAEECRRRLNDKVIQKIEYLNWSNSLWDEIHNCERLKYYNEIEGLYATLLDGVRVNEDSASDVLLVLLCNRAKNLVNNLNKPLNALPLLLEVVSSQKNINTPNRFICSAYYELAYCYAALGDYEQLDILIPQAKEYLIFANFEDYPPGTIYRCAGKGAFAMKDFHTAVKYYKLGVDSFSKDKWNNLYISAINELSVAYILMEKPNKARHLLEGLLKTTELPSKNEVSSQLALVYHNLGRSYMLLNDITMAIKYLNHSKDLQMELLGCVNMKTLQYIDECNRYE